MPASPRVGPRTPACSIVFSALVVAIGAGEAPWLRHLAGAVARYVFNSGSRRGFFFLQAARPSWHHCVIDER